MWDDEEGSGSRGHMLVVVTGATGFLGKRVVRRLVDGGHSVRALLHRQQGEGLFPGQVELARGDVTNLSSLAGVFDGANTIVHLAAVLVERGGQTFERVNVQGTRNVIGVAEAAGAAWHMSVVDAC
jgi:nucleoside-diphosphate-sugar epimerase